LQKSGGILGERAGVKYAFSESHRPWWPHWRMGKVLRVSKVAFCPGVADLKVRATGTTGVSPRRSGSSSWVMIACAGLAVIVDLLPSTVETTAQFRTNGEGTTSLTCRPRPVMLSSKRSPGARKIGVGFMPSATPAGVPVEMIIPGVRVMNWLT